MVLIEKSDYIPASSLAVHCTTNTEQLTLFYFSETKKIRASMKLSKSNFSVV